MAKKQKEKERLGTSKRLAERITSVMYNLDSDCRFAQLNTEILEKQTPKKMALMYELINGGLEQLFSTIQGGSFDIGFVIGYATGQISDVPDRRFKAAVEEAKKLIMDRGALPEIKNP